MPAIAYPARGPRLYQPPETPPPIVAELDIAIPGRYRLTAWHPDAWAALEPEERDRLTPDVSWVGGFVVLYERAGPLPAP